MKTLKYVIVAFACFAVGYGQAFGQQPIQCPTLDQQPCLSNPNQVYCENGLPGDADWKIFPADKFQPTTLEGYASQTSVNKGELVHLFISTSTGTSQSPTSVQLEVYRMGWYGCDATHTVVPPAGARKILTITSVPAYRQATWPSVPCPITNPD